MPLSAIEQLPRATRQQIRTIFTDLDDTLTRDGLVEAAAFAALWRAADAGLQVIVVTGRPAGWCDHLARMWPVAAVVGENGALAFARRAGRMRRIYANRPSDARARLDAIAEQVLAEVPRARVAADQAYREHELAIDFCEEVSPPLDEAQIDRIAAIFAAHGATAKVSSIHVNGWFGAHDKLSMCRRCCEELLGVPFAPQHATFVGDSPNDVPMFRAFPHAVGVANVRALAHRMDALPAYVTRAPGGAGFAEVVDLLLEGSG